MIQLLLHIYINKHLYHRQPKQFRTLHQNSCFDKQREYIFFKMRFMIKFQTELEKQNFTSMIAFEKKIHMYKTEKLQQLETKFQLIL